MAGTWRKLGIALGRTAAALAVLCAAPDALGWPGDRPMIEMAENALPFTEAAAPDLAFVFDEERDALYWVLADGGMIPVFERNVEDEEAARLGVEREGPKFRFVLEFLEGLVHFVDGFAERGDNRTLGDFRSQFIHEMGEDFPGLSWVLIAYRSSVEMDQNIRISREGGGFGIQYALAGSDDLFLEPGDGAVVFRFLPLAGNLERTVHFGGGDRAIETEESGIRVRPTIEIELRYRPGGFLRFIEPGVRVLGQLDPLHPEDFRAVGEAFLDFRIPVGGEGVEEIHINPHCMVDFTSEPSRFTGMVPGFSSALVPDGGGGFQVFGRWVTCSINAKLVFGR